MSSTGEICLDLMRSSRSVADWYARFWSGMMLVLRDSQGVGLGYGEWGWGWG